MKKALLFTALLINLGITSGWAQWQTRLGVNGLLLPLRTLEITGEFKRQPWYSLTVNTGYVHQSGYKGIGGVKLDDMIDNRSSSGWFGKAGGRLYFLSFTGHEPAVNVFLGVQVIAASYNQSGIQPRDSYENGALVSSFSEVNARGFMAGGALTGGLTFSLSKRFQLDAGVQYSVLPRRDDYVGYIGFNYQPGFGVTNRGGRYLKSFQGLLVLSYLL